MLILSLDLRFRINILIGMQHDDPNDFLFPDEPPSTTELAANRVASDPRTFRVEAYGEQAVPFSTLIAAIAEPPMDPESVVRDAAGRALAVCEHGRAAWRLTLVGAQRVDDEAHGRRAA